MTSKLESRADLIRQWPPAALSSLKSKLTSEAYGLVYSVYADLCLSHLWEDVETHTLEHPYQPLISGIASSQGSERKLVYPVGAKDTTSIQALHYLFAAIQKSLGESEKRLLLGIVHTDSTVVYYKVNEGIVKPTVN